VFVDARGTDAQRSAMADIFTGPLGGTAAGVPRAPKQVSKHRHDAATATPTVPDLQGTTLVQQLVIAAEMVRGR
jgi:hypothetical protein